MVYLQIYFTFIKPYVSLQTVNMWDFSCITSVLSSYAKIYSNTYILRLTIIYIYIYIYIYTTLPVNAAVQPPHAWIGDSTLCWQAHLQLRHIVLKPPSLPFNPKAKGIKPQQVEMVGHIHIIYIGYRLWATKPLNHM